MTLNLVGRAPVLALALLVAALPTAVAQASEKVAQKELKAGTKAAAKQLKKDVKSATSELFDRLKEFDGILKSGTSTPSTRTTSTTATAGPSTGFGTPS